MIKPATDTAWIVRLYAECLRDAGFPDGVVNFVTGPGSTLGQALVDSKEVDGATFTGSFDVGMKMYRDFAQRNYVRPDCPGIGRQESRHRFAPCQSDGCRDWHRSLRIRSAGTEMFGRFTGHRGRTGLR